MPQLGLKGKAITMSRTAKTGLAVVFFLGFALWIVKLTEPAPLVFNSPLSAQQAATPNSARPPVVPGKASPATRITYAVAKEEVYDAPAKTQIVQHIVVSGIPTEAELRTEIFKRYRSAKARRGFRYYNPATNIYIYVYGTKEQARAQGIRWIGMLAISKGDKGEPRVVVDEGRLAALSQKPEDRFGLSEQRRKRVFREIAAAEDRATREAMARVPDSQVMKQIDLESKLQEKYRAEIARKYNLTEDQLLKISVEGVTKGWVD